MKPTEAQWQIAEARIRACVEEIYALGELEDIAVAATITDHEKQEVDFKYCGSVRDLMMVACCIFKHVASITDRNMVCDTVSEFAEKLRNGEFDKGIATDEKI